MRVCLPGSTLWTTAGSEDRVIQANRSELLQVRARGSHSVSSSRPEEATERSLFGQVWQDESERPSDSVAKGNYHNQRVMEGVPYRIKAVLLV